MSPPSCTCAAPVRPAVVVNAEIRRLSEGRTDWSPEALGVLAVLRAEWAAARAREAADAA